ncbi:YhfX family PLP-dependent enzyme [Clostridiales bacterium COT073_COT-073]|nr:YhfX family PLP-dependent enzyme [Clostridiales bacterium COT073_COT-073]
MFLEQLQKRNPEFIKEAVKLYSQGKIHANSYVIDLDRVEKNASAIAKEAQKYGLHVFAMTKQIGRNPEIALRIAKAGIESFVAVDPWEAQILAEAGLKLGNIGHLVQIPEHMMKEIIQYRPEVVTVFSYEKAVSVNKAAAEIGIVQPVILKVVAEGDKIYEGQQGGIEEADWKNVTAKIIALKNVKIVGLTSFPCFLFQEESKKIEKMPNMDTVMRAKKLLEKEFDLQLFHINSPSASTSSSMKAIAEAGGTYCEPGHALTGTTPLHSVSEEVEIPAMLYITEVSHLFQSKAYTFFGGYYRRGHLQKVAVFSKEGEFKGIFSAEENDAQSIDYYGAFTPDSQIISGDICVYAFRTQIFTTRSQVVLLEGMETGNVHIVGIYDSQGRSLTKV